METRYAQLFEGGMVSPLNPKQVAFIGAYTGIEPSQLDQMTSQQKDKVFLSLSKQLDLCVSLHGLNAKKAYKSSLDDYFNSQDSTIDNLTQKVNGLLVFGEVVDLEGTGVAHLHERLAHFWRILGWEELEAISMNGTYKNQSGLGSVEAIVDECGNLVRTLDLLAEAWSEFGIGPKLLYPSSQSKPKIAREGKNGYMSAKLQTDYTQTLAVLTGRNSDFPTEETKQDYKEKELLLERLLEKYPVEFAYAIFEYYAFCRGFDKNAYNVAIVQEYVNGGQRHVKGLMNGKCAVICGKIEDQNIVSQKIIGLSNANTVTGAPNKTQFEMFDVAVDDNSVLSLVHGGVASVVADYPDILQTFQTPVSELRKKIAQFSKAIGLSKLEKPILTLPLGKTAEYKPKVITEATLEEEAARIREFCHNAGIGFINIEAGHIHADHSPTRRQQAGIGIGAFLSKALDGIEVKQCTMVDEDHVPNTIDYRQYLLLMGSLGFPVDEVVLESSPVVREIAVSAISALFAKYPDYLYNRGNALIFNIPGTSLEVELIKDVNVAPFELGCVIFDVGLTLYKTHPELAHLYSLDDGSFLHREMLSIYNQYQNPDQRLAAVKAAVPIKTDSFDQIKDTQELPEVNGKRAIINVLEGFYSPQQDKLKGVMQALGLPIIVIDVCFSQDGLQVVLPD